jgi:hypothetical protein
MIQNVLREVGGIGIYGVISVCLFFAVFSGAMIWSFLQKKSLLKTMSQLPLEEDCDASRSGRKGENCHE